MAFLISSCNLKSNNNEIFLQNVTKDYISDINDFIYDNNKESLNRILIDLNDDGLIDVLLSGYYKGSWSNAGGSWTVYYQTENDGFEKCKNTIFMYPDVARYDKNNSQIILYSRMGCCEGSVVFKKIMNCNTEIIKQIKIEGETGDEVSLKVDSIFNKYNKFELEYCYLEKNDSIIWTKQ